MNLNISEESHTISMDQQSASLNLMQANHLQTVLQLEHTMSPPTQLPTLATGERESNQILMPSEQTSQAKREINSVKPSSNLKSNVKVQEILARAPEVRILKVSKADIEALSQVISEFQEQFVGY
jgi:hypothetical protein